MSESTCRIGAFSDVDRAADPEFFVKYLEQTSRVPMLQAVKLRSFNLLSLQPGDAVLDVGCGLGDDALALASIVGPTGRSVGLDSSVVMIDQARQRAGGVGRAVEFLVGDAANLDFPDGTFAGCRAERVLQHVSDHRRVFQEMVRVVRPGGVVVVFDPDWESLLVDHPARALTRAILNHRCDRISNGWSGRQLYGRFKAEGLESIDISYHTNSWTSFVQGDAQFSLTDSATSAANAGTISSPAAERWLADLANADRDGRFFIAVTGFLVSGRKPG